MMFTRYQNRSGNSGVMAYEIVEDGIRVRFVDGATYTYTFESAGRVHGEGLSGYIATHVRHRYASKSDGGRCREKPGRRTGLTYRGIRR